MKRFAMSVALVCVLSSATLAGNVPTTDYVPPPPGETQTPPSVTSPGDIPMPLAVLEMILDFAF